MRMQSTDTMFPAWIARANEKQFLADAARLQNCVICTIVIKAIYIVRWVLILFFLGVGTT